MVTNTGTYIDCPFHRYEDGKDLSEVALERLSYLTISCTDPEKAQSIAGRHVSMDAPLGTDSDNDMHHVFFDKEGNSPEDELLEGSLTDEINRIFETLSPREADIIKLYFGIGQTYAFTLEEISEKFDLTRERVRQLKEKGLRKLKQKSRSKLLKSYLG